MKKAGLLAVTLLCLPLWQQVIASQDVSSHIRAQIDRMRAGDCVKLDDCPISSTIVLPALYEKYRYQPIWKNADAVSQLLAAIEDSYHDGLDPQDYHRAGIRRLQASLAAGGDPTTQADLDLVLTDSLVRLGYHLLIGKVDPESLDSNWNMERTLELDPILALSGAGGWPAVPAGDTLRPGMNDPRVTAIRRRLVVTGDMPTMDLDSHAFDDTVESGVKHFQRRHGLTEDGVVGEGTLAELNVPVEARIDQLRVNLERARWVLHDLPEDFVLTDIAGFNVRYFRSGQLVWLTRAQVGKAYRKTPVFRDRIRYIEFNPTWTVPPTILRQDILPKVKKDRGYLEEKNLQVIDREGKAVDAATIDWSRYPAAGFPYLLRQDPGPTNALGRVKFMFPNKHAVYLHDTPHRSEFDRARRAFSSGCIRIEDPFAFAGLLLDDRPEWDTARIEQVIESRKTTRVNLTEPLTVLLLYWTAEVDADRRVVFRSDIYDRDAAVLSALDGRFEYRDSPVIRQP
jgi:murein L,D-transpeptidase YcbB/YkuD